MPNPLFDNLKGAGASQGQNQQMNMGDLMRNPNQVLNILASRNPQLYQFIKSGGNPEQMVRNICKQRGIDVDQFISQLFK